MREEYFAISRKIWMNSSLFAVVWFLFYLKQKRECYLVDTFKKKILNSLHRGAFNFVISHSWVGIVEAPGYSGSSLSPSSIETRAHLSMM